MSSQDTAQSLFLQLISNFITQQNARDANRSTAVAVLRLCCVARNPCAASLSGWGYRAMHALDGQLRRWATERANAAEAELRRITRLVRSNADGTRGGAVERVTALITEYNVDHATLRRMLRERPELADVAETIRRQATFWQGQVASDVDTSEEEDTAEEDEL